MKIIRFTLRFSVALIITIVLICAGLAISGNSHVIKAVRSTYLQGKKGPTIDDYNKFENRKVEVGREQRWVNAPSYNEYKVAEELLKETEDMKTVALVVIKDKKLVFEKYWNNYSENSKTNSFSMAKSFTSLCIGAAIMEGKIKSEYQKIGDFIPGLANSNVTIKDLLTMSSGIDFGESYGDPFGFMAKTYYGTDLFDLTVSKNQEKTPGLELQYQGGNTLLLSFLIEKATGKSLSAYFSEKFWQPIGAKQAALWTLNEKDGIEKAYCCFYSNAKDYARIGQLMLDSGRWNDEQLISKAYFEQSIQPVNISNNQGTNIDYYGYQWWLGSYKGVDFHYARGIQGQYIVSIPKWNTVVVRLGHRRDPERGAKVPKDLFTYLEIANQAVGE